MKKITYKSLAILSVSALLGACTGNFEEMNTSPLGVSDKDLEQDNKLIGMHFPTMIKSIYYNNSGGNWEFQVIQNLNADVWSGYMATSSVFKGNVQNETYFLCSDWNDYCWDYAYGQIMSNEVRVREKCDAVGGGVYDHYKALNTIIRVFAMSRLADQYGPIIYTKYGDTMVGGTYDSAQDVYKAFFKELTDAGALLNSVNQANVPSFADFDPAYGGDLAKWVRFANSLRLRLAMRIVKYDPTWAKNEGEAAINAPGGLMNDGENFTVGGSGWTHPLYEISNIWKNIFICANIQSILGGYNDPRLAKFGNAVNGQVVGVRTGIPNLENTAADYVKVVSTLNLTKTSPAVIFTKAEVDFLLAEAALRGWNVGGKTAKELYEAGIAVSFQDYGVSLGDYLSRTNLPAAWVDPVVPEFNAAAVSKVSVKWEDATTDEERLEKIITQKWIAGFPEGMNAWAEWRRTGYPKLFPILKNDSQGEIDTNEGVRRLPYTVDEHANNPAGVADAVQKLGGPDKGSTRIFWDMNKPNF